MKQIDSKYILFIILMILGMAITIQFKTILNENEIRASRALKLEDAKDKLTKEKELTEKLKKLIDENTRKQDDALKAFTSIKKYNDQEKQLAICNLKGGFTDVKGYGIIINISDSINRVDPDPNLNIIHDFDLVKILNELKKAGAQAISINNERIITTSEQMCAGPTIRINKKRCSNPFEIKAIGVPDVLYDAVDKSYFVNSMRDSGIKCDITKSNDILILKYSEEQHSANALEGIE